MGFMIFGSASRCLVCRVALGLRGKRLEGDLNACVGTMRDEIEFGVVLPKVVSKCAETGVMCGSFIFAILGILSWGARARIVCGLIGLIPSQDDIYSLGNTLPPGIFQLLHSSPHVHC